MTRTLARAEANDPAGTRLAHRRYVDFSRADYAGNLVDGGYVMGLFSDIATDVESGVDVHPAVQESAAVGVPSELSEDDIKIFVVRQPDTSLTPRDVVEHCHRMLPRHMVPRYVELVSDVPKTPTEKIERSTLAALPLNSTTWDTTDSTQSAGKAYYEFG